WSEIRDALQLRRADVRRGQVDRMERRCRSLLVHPPVQRLLMTPRAARWAPVAALILLALAASAGGIRNGFTYDDRYIIVMNGAAHHLHHWWRLFKMSYWPPDWGAEGYRPLTSLFFAVEWVAGRGAPWVFHGVNVVLYLATTAAVFALASSLLPAWAAWLAAAFFAVHPVHVEAVANSVGQSELWVALATVLATAL